MNCVITWIAFVLLLGNAFGNEKHLQFEAPDGYLNNLHILSHTELLSTTIFASTPEETIIIVKGKNPDPYKLTFNCKVKTMADNYAVTNTKFCFVTDNGDDCLNVSPGGNEFDKTFAHGLNIKGTAYAKVGLTVEADLEEGKNDKSGKYYCVVESKFELVRSNYFEIMDIMFMENNQLKPQAEANKDTTLPTLTNADLPKSFECGTVRTDQIKPKYHFYLKSQANWILCRLDDLSSPSGPTCLGQARSDQSRIVWHHSLGESEILFDNTLVYTQWGGSNTGSKALFCMFENKLMSIYWGDKAGTELKIDSSGSYPSFKAVSPLTQTVMLRRGKLFSPKKSIKLLYQSTNKANAKWSFIKKGSGTAGNLPNGFTALSDELKLPEFIADDANGEFILTVGTNQFKINVLVYGPPTLSAPVPTHFYVMVGGDVIVKVDYLQTDTSKDILINGRPVVLKFNQKPEVSGLSSVLKDLDIDIKPSPLKLSEGVTYTVKNLKVEPNSDEPQSHIVTFVGSNIYGKIFTDVNIRVLRKPKYVNKPDSCFTNCMNYDLHAFNCQVKEEEYKQQGVVVHYFWTVNNVDLDLSVLKPYAEVMPNNTLLLNKIFRDDGEKGAKALDILRNASITCRVRLFNPLINKLSDAHKNTVDNEYLVFDSKNDAEISKVLTATVVLTEDGSVSPVTANLGWIAGVVVAIVIILIIIALTVYMLMRSKGETYLVDQKERAQGNDPEKEIRENEVFHNYERPEDAPVRGSRFSLNDESVGVGSESEGELEEYDLDPGNFNEEGSFIGQYANDRKKALPSANNSASAGLLKNNTQV